MIIPSTQPTHQSLPSMPPTHQQYASATSPLAYGQYAPAQMHGPSTCVQPVAMYPQEFLPSNYSNYHSSSNFYPIHPAPPSAYHSLEATDQSGPVANQYFPVIPQPNSNVEYPSASSSLQPMRSQGHHHRSSVRDVGSRASASQETSDTSGSSTTAAMSRGPPCKPRQSGFALWVGNLPPGATVIDLKDHFSREATNDIESLRIMSKSNCAFVNYRTRASCEAARLRFHESRFHGQRLACRFRNSIPVAAPSGEASVPFRSQLTITAESSRTARIPEEGQTGMEHTTQPTSTPVPARYFVLKSYTMNDLLLSVRDSLWATQPQNESKLNEAFKVRDFSSIELP